MVESIRAEADRLRVDVVGPFLYLWSAQEGEDCLRPIRGEGVSGCPLINRPWFFNANGNARMCCVRTVPLFNWRELGPERFDSLPAVVLARGEALDGVTPRACSGTACSYFAGELSPRCEGKPLTYIERRYI